MLWLVKRKALLEFALEIVQDLVMDGHVRRQNQLDHNLGRV